jgi:pilus assembly protein CpaC
MRNNVLKRCEMQVKKRLRVLGFALLVLGSGVQSAGAETVITVGRSALVSVPRDMGEVIVANPAVADVYVHGKTKVSIIAKSLGKTTVRIFDPANNVLKTLDVNVSYDLPAIRQALKELLPHEVIDVKTVNTNIALTGQISSASSAAQAVDIVKEYVAPSFGPNAVAGGSNEEPKVLNLMTIATGQQVMLRVRVGEIQRTALKNLGVNLQAIRNGSDAVFAIGTGGGVSSFIAGSDNAFGQYDVSTTSSRGFISGTYQNSAGNGISGMLEALERDGLFKLLAEPNLVAMSGEEAKFLAGGEFPIPMVQQQDQVSIEYKPFGVSVNFQPTVLADNRIRIMVEPEVSEISSEGAIKISGFDIPALKTRRAKTTLEMAPGESFMIAGLLLDQMESTIDQLPGLGEVPILSALFRSTAYKRQETELVLAVTPYLVDPMSANDVKLPTDEFKPASVMEAFFYGALGAIPGDTIQRSQVPSVEGPVGFMVD